MKDTQDRQRDVRRNRHSHTELSARARDRAERRQARAQVGARVAFVHTLTDPSIGPKQPGRRYGPAPKQTSVGGLQRAEWTSPRPLDPYERERHYSAQRQHSPRITPRQRRRMRKKFNHFYMPIPNEGPRD